MRYAFATSALLAGASYSTVASALSLPIRNAAPGSFTLDLHRRTDTNAVSRRASLPGPVSIDNLNNDWFVKATAGGQEVELMVDTGSADLWILAPSAQSASPGAATYDPSKSTTAKQMQGYTFDTKYAVGQEASGNMYTDKVCLGDVCLDQRPIGSATTASQVSDYHSGIIGFSFTADSAAKPQPQKTFMEQLQPQLAQPIMSFKLGAEGQTGSLTFGSVDPNSYDLPLQTVQADSQNSNFFAGWLVPNAGYSVNGKQLGTHNILFDTGNPPTSAPIEVVRAYYDAIQGAKDVHGDGTAWTVPCDGTIPDLTFNLGSGYATIPGSKLNMGDAGDGQCSVWFISNGGLTYSSAGAAFFRQHVVIYDQEKTTISWGGQR